MGKKAKIGPKKSIMRLVRKKSLNNFSKTSISNQMSSYEYTNLI